MVGSWMGRWVVSTGPARGVDMWVHGIWVTLLCGYNNIMQCRPHWRTSLVSIGVASVYYTTINVKTRLSSRRFGSSKSTSVLIGPVKHRLSRAPSDPPRPRDHATPAPHGGQRCHRRQIGRQRRTRRAGSAGKGAPGDGLARSPLWRVIIKTWKSQYDTASTN